MLMAVSLLSSLFISYLYVHFYSNRATGSQVHRAFPLLGISVTAIFVTIQFSLPLSLGLLGALSIVRFRTPIKEPEEIGFIMLVISTSIAVATFKLAFVGIIFVVALAALFGQALTRRGRAPGRTARSSSRCRRTASPRIPRQSRRCFASGCRRRSSRASRKPIGETVVSYNFQGCPDNALGWAPGRAQRRGRFFHATTSFSTDLAHCKCPLHGGSLRGCSSSRRRRFASATLTLESADLFPLWRFAVQWSPEALPSSRAVPPAEVASGVPVLSLTLDEADLHDPAKGLLPNKLRAR